MPELEIVGVPQSNYVWTCRIACVEKGVPYVHVSAPPHSPEVAAIHPFGKIPVMRHAEVKLFELRAICAYIDGGFAGPALVPAPNHLAAQVEQWISLINTEIDPLLMRQYLSGYFFPGTPDGQPNRARIDAALPKMPAHFAVLDRGVGKTGFLVGDGFSLADAFLLPILFYMSRLPESKAMIDETRNLNAYLGKQMERKSVKETTPPPPPGRN